MFPFPPRRVVPPASAALLTAITAFLSRDRTTQRSFPSVHPFWFPPQCSVTSTVRSLFGAGAGSVASKAVLASFFPVTRWFHTV